MRGSPPGRQCPGGLPTFGGSGEGRYLLDPTVEDVGVVPQQGSVLAHGDRADAVESDWVITGGLILWKSGCSCDF